jgi:hypothetical protein
MNTKEKMLLVQLILEDIRGNWAYNAEERAEKALELCKEIANATNNEDYSILADYCATYINSSRRWDDWDGRFFRQPFPMGYENMNSQHNLKNTFKDKSKEFKSIAKEYLTYPEYRFNDWEDIEDE